MERHERALRLQRPRGHHAQGRVTRFSDFRHHISYKFHQKLVTKSLNLLTLTSGHHAWRMGAQRPSQHVRSPLRHGHPRWPSPPFRGQTQVE